MQIPSLGDTTTTRTLKLPLRMPQNFFQKALNLKFSGDVCPQTPFKRLWAMPAGPKPTIPLPPKFKILDRTLPATPNDICIDLASTTNTAICSSCLESLQQLNGQMSCFKNTVKSHSKSCQPLGCPSSPHPTHQHNPLLIPPTLWWRSCKCTAPCSKSGKDLHGQLLVMTSATGLQPSCLVSTGAEVSVVYTSFTRRTKKSARQSRLTSSQW